MVGSRLADKLLLSDVTIREIITCICRNAMLREKGLATPKAMWSS